MITVQNYGQQKEIIDWKSMPKAIQDNRYDVEDIMEFYYDDKDIKETVDLFIKQINDNSKPVGEIIFGKVPKVQPKSEPLVIYKEGKYITKKTLQSDYSFTDNENFAYTWTESEINTAEQIAKGYDGLVITMSEAKKLTELMIASKANREKTYPAKTKKETQPQPKFNVGDIVYYKQVGMIDKIKSKKLASGFDDDADGSVKWFYELPKYGDIMAAEEMLQLATQPQIDSLKTTKLKETAKTKKETPSDNAKKLGQLLYEYANLSNRMVKLMSSSKSVAETLTYDQLNDKLEKTVTEISYLIEGKYSEAKEYIKEWVSKNGSLFVFDEKKYLEAAKKAYNIDKKPEAKTPAKTKVAKVIDKKFVDNFSIEFQLIRRFWNIIKDKNIEIPFRKTQLLFMAFNKAAIERKVRKTSEVADIFNQCNEKMRILFEEFAKPTQAPIKVDEFSDKKLFKEIEDYVSDVAINPAVSVLKRFIAIQNTTPDLKKAEAIKKSLEKVLANDTNNRLSSELKDAIKWINDYIKKPSTPVETEVYGLSVPKVCKNRVKCSGLTPNGRLKKGYRFEEDSNNVIKVVKGLGSPKVCKNRVKCAGLTAKGQLRPGYKFREDTNEVVRVPKAPAKRKPATKKPPLKKKVNVGLGFSDDVERIYTNNQLIPITGQPEFQQPEAPTAVQEKISQPAPDQVQPTVVKNKLMNMQFDSLNMDEGWENFMQNPAKNMKMAIWGAPKNGKTAGSLQLANYLSKFGKVLYNFADQGFNKSTQDLWQMSGLANNAKAEPSDVQTLADLEKEVAIGKYTFVFIDMISDYINKEGIKPYEFKERFMKKYPKVSFILIFEVTKGGNFKGDQGWTHIVDAIVTVEDFLMENRGRYGVGSHIVWEDGLRKFNPKRYSEVMEELNPDQLEFNEVERI